VSGGWAPVPSPVPPRPRCTALGGAHYLTCPTLRLPPGDVWDEGDG
jgi:hypothetical protein